MTPSSSNHKQLLTRRDSFCSYEQNTRVSLCTHDLTLPSTGVVSKVVCGLLKFVKCGLRNDDVYKNSVFLFMA